MDRVFGDFGVPIGRDVFDDSLAGPVGSFEFAAAVGTLGQLVLDVPIDPLGLAAVVSVVPVLPAGFLPPFPLRLRLLERG